ncbi:MBL fold metallo-hydrolase (plasmid) [Rhizobium sp. RCAM05350]|nr:MBL fold metallo-hydrolase [Rhizobium sp. RCAM05350]
MTLSPEQISRLGISHNHFDHVGQAATFPQATLMIGAADLAQFKADPLPFAVDPAFIKPWLDGGSKVDAISGDRDVFGDGTVTILSTPGHTPGRNEPADPPCRNRTGPAFWRRRAFRGAVREPWRTGGSTSTALKRWRRWSG